ncbi:MerR family transcriptional regulator [Candidatus Babeliales bacterium]|nr:MerR family transcriptional regulator [Candidatus Babeliales bacterium]
MKRRKKGAYSISVVAEMFGVHQQTVRLYEKEGLINPHRSSGNTRQFTEEDVDQLEEIIYLTHKLGVNISGVNVILKLQKKIKRLQTQMNKLFEQTNEQLEEDSQRMKQDVKSSAQRLLKIKNEQKQISDKKIEEPTEGNVQDVSYEEWDLDYNE